MSSQDALQELAVKVKAQQDAKAALTKKLDSLRQQLQIISETTTRVVLDEENARSTIALTKKEIYDTKVHIESLKRMLSQETASRSSLSETLKSITAKNIDMEKRLTSCKDKFSVDFQKNVITMQQREEIIENQGDFKILYICVTRCKLIYALYHFYGNRMVSLFRLQRFPRQSPLSGR